MTKERVGYLVLALLVGVYVVARAVCVPWVHDECASLFWFVERGEFLPFSAHWDANNHILSSAIGTASYRVFGLGLFASRVGSVFAFLVFAWAAFRIGSLVADRVVRWSLWISLLLCPFMLEFFSLFRGYGLEMAFWLLALDGLVRFAEGFRTRHLIQVLSALVLANAAVLALVPLWALIIGAIGLVLLWRWRRMAAMERGVDVLAWALLGAAPLLYGLWVAFELRSKGLLYHGSTEGFIAVAVEPLLGYVFGGYHLIIGITAMGIVGLSTMVVVLGRAWRSPLFLIAVLFWGDVALRIGMAHFLGVNYPQDRAALHLLPLAILLIAFAADRLALHRASLRYVVLVLLVLPARTLVTANLDHTSIWPEQSVPTRFIQHLAEAQRGKDRPLIVGAYHQLDLCLPYGARLAHAEIGIVDPVGFPNGSHDARIVDQRFLEEARPGYHVVDSALANGLYLLMRNAPLRTSRVEERPIQHHDARKEFLELWSSDQGVTEELFIEFDGTLASDTGYLDLELVVSAKDSAGADLLYNTTSLALIHSRWRGEHFHTGGRVPPVPGAKYRVVYIWNVLRSSVQLSDGRVGVSVLDNKDQQ